MFGHRSFLVLGGDLADIVSLVKGGLEISNCNFSFLQGIDETGKATTKVYGGVIEVTIPQLPPANIINWAINPRKYESGAIILLDNENLPLERIIFENAACVDFEIEYKYVGKDYTTTKFSIQAEKLIVGDGVNFENEWVND